MIATISKDFAFSASHQLHGLRDDHPCGRTHGHNFIARVEITGEVHPPGFVLDYGELAGFGTWVDATLDHRHLNDVLDVNPTSEHLAGCLLSVLRSTLPRDAHLITLAVSVSETPKTWCRYEEKA